jgi:UDP-2,3-diacylglucosamine pyrophosphatase LpxH
VTDIVLLSDVHLGARRPGLDAPDAFTDDAALVGLVEHLAAASPIRVVLLGDIVDLVMVGARRPRPLRRSASAACAALDAIAEAHGDVLAALGRLCATPGVRAELVPGNHDLELVLPAVAAHFRRLLQVASGERRVALAVEPWAVYEPGLLLAEHGHQAHDLNRVARLSSGRRDLGVLPVAAAIDAVLAARAAGERPLRLAAHVAAALPRATAGALAMTRPSGLQAPPGLPGAVVDALAREARSGPVQALRRVAARRGPIDLDAVAASHAALLARTGHPVRYVVMGHTHRPGDRPLPAGARVLGTGTWSDMGPGRGSRTLVRVVADPPGARVEHWDADAAVLTRRPPAPPHGAVVRTSGPSTQ